MQLGLVERRVTTARRQCLAGTYSRLQPQRRQHHVRRVGEEIHRHRADFLGIVATGLQHRVAQRSPLFKALSDPLGHLWLSRRLMHLRGQLVDQRVEFAAAITE
ncbi:hypothetical protein D3C76_1512470 [compost metagenome]